jgi:nucleotide-binding universal stress UspA family protein
MVTDAQQYLESVATGLRERGRDVVVVAEVGTPAATIADVAGKQDADVVVMATHGRTGLARVLMGSVATGTLHRARTPLVLFRPPTLGQPS